jgi:hypothetical protein
VITVSLEVNGETTLGMVGAQLVMNNPSHTELNSDVTATWQH